MHSTETVIAYYNTMVQFLKVKFFWISNFV